MCREGATEGGRALAHSEDPNPTKLPLGFGRLTAPYGIEKPRQLPPTRCASNAKKEMSPTVRERERRRTSNDNLTRGPSSERAQRAQPVATPRRPTKRHACRPHPPQAGWRLHPPALAARHGIDRDQLLSAPATGSESADSRNGRSETMALIDASLGHSDQAEYDRQLEHDRRAALRAPPRRKEGLDLMRACARSRPGLSLQDALRGQADLERSTRHRGRNLALRKPRDGGGVCARARRARAPGHGSLQNSSAATRSRAALSPGGST